MKRCFCCQKAITGEVTYSIKEEDITFEFCSEECYKDAQEYIKQSKLFGFDKLLILYFVLTILGFLLERYTSSYIEVSIITKGLSLLLGIAIVLRPYVYKSLLIRTGVSKSRKGARIAGCIIITLSISSILF